MAGYPIEVTQNFYSALEEGSIKSKDIWKLFQAETGPYYKCQDYDYIMECEKYNLDEIQRHYQLLEKVVQLAKSNDSNEASEIGQVISPAEPEPNVTPFVEELASQLQEDFL